MSRPAVSGTQAGLVVAGFGRHVLVEKVDGERVICHPRGKKGQAVVGDRVRWLPSEDEGTIEKVEPRDNLFYRQDELRTKSFAANLDQVLILMAAEPEFSENQLTRALIAAEATGIRPVIALNKSDLTEPFGRAWAKLAPYRAMGYQMLSLAIKPKAEDDPGQTSVHSLMPLMQGKKTLVLGPSGAGKSSLTNLGLHHIEPMHLAGYMPDLKVHAQDCKFYNCTHLHEPGCGVIAELNRSDSASSISASRYRLYGELFAELSQTRY
ncbi:MAG: GTPase RsgA [Polaromonas sp.]|nr:GTPase RsgA [Polaromonas sp.]